MLDLEKQVSREIDENIRKTLVPFLGLGNFEASVSTRLNLDKKQISETAFDPGVEGGTLNQDDKETRKLPELEQQMECQRRAEHSRRRGHREQAIRYNRARATSGKRRPRISR